jgi:hypothetical protein
MRAATLLLVSAAILVIAAPAGAQVGIQAGWNYSMPTVQVDGQDVGSVKDVSGFNVGIFTERGGMIGFMGGAYYSQKGFDSDTASVNLDYIEVPVMLRVTIPFIRAYAGINLGFEIDCNTQNGPVLLNGEAFFCEDNQTEAFDFGYKVGVGGKLLMFSLDVAYIFGTTDVWKSEAGTIKNRVVQVDLGLSF